MTPNDDMRAVARILAFAVSEGNYDDAEKLLGWAYKKDGEEKEPGTKAEKPKENSVSFRADMAVHLWNELMTRNIPKVRDCTKDRAKKVSLRIDEMGGIKRAIDTLETCFRKLNDSDFCNGKTGWVATFDWFFSNDKNWHKVMEGNYDNRKEKTQLDTLGENIAKADAYYEQRFGKPGAGANGNPAGGREDGPDEQ